MAVIKLSLSDDGQSLVVTGVNENHNHDISKVNRPILIHVQSIYIVTRGKSGLGVSRTYGNLYAKN